MCELKRVLESINQCKKKIALQFKSLQFKTLEVAYILRKA